MTLEDELKKYILKRYKSLREFTIRIDMSYSTMTSILSRGIDGASVGNIAKICKGLGISMDALGEGKIEPITSYKKPSERIFEVKEILDDVKDQLSHVDGLTLEGKPINKKSIDSIINTIDVGVEIAKRNKD